MLFRRCLVLVLLALLSAGPASAQEAPPQEAPKLEAPKPDIPKPDVPKPDIIGPLIKADQAAAPEKATIVVFGDSQGEGVAAALHRLLRNDAALKVRNLTKAGTAISQKLDYDWPAKVAQFAKDEHADIAVMMFGGNDRLPARVENDRPIPFRSEAWKALYQQRVAAMADSLVAAGIKVIWCGDPVAREAGYRRDMEYLNGLYQEALAGKAGVEYLPLWNVVADEQGNFSASGKALDGTTQKLRLDDGIHFTPRGYDIVGTRILAVVNQRLAKPAP